MSLTLGKIDVIVPTYDPNNCKISIERLGLMRMNFGYKNRHSKDAFSKVKQHCAQNISSTMRKCVEHNTPIQREWPWNSRTVLQTAHSPGRKQKLIARSMNLEKQLSRKT